MNLIEKPIKDPAVYIRIWEKAKAKTYPEIDRLEKETGFAIDKGFLDTLALHTQVVVKTSEICYQHGRILYFVLRKHIKDTGTNDVAIIETGTARGFSTVCMAKALIDSGAHGFVTTHDILDHTTPRWWNCIDDTEKKKSREEILNPWENLTRLRAVFITGETKKTLHPIGRIHFAFLDSGHTYETVTMEADRIAPLQQKGDIIIFDDYEKTMFPGVVKAVDRACEKHAYTKNVIRANHQRQYVIATKDA